LKLNRTALSAMAHNCPNLLKITTTDGDDSEESTLLFERKNGSSEFRLVWAGDSDEENTAEMMVDAD
jgi:hypothetical protein